MSAGTEPALKSSSPSLSLSLTPKRCKRASTQLSLSALPNLPKFLGLVLAAKRVKEVARFRDSS